VAVKIIDLRTVDNEVTQYLLDMEKAAIMSVVNPNVLRGLKVTQNNRFCFIVTELCNGGSLKSLIRSNGPLGEEKSTKILVELLKGMCSIIGKGILHRDLKPANILFHNGQAKIIDFGYCEIKGYPKPDLEYNVGSPSYMSP
jgi:serine/threonine protein kinase